MIFFGLATIDYDSNFVGMIAGGGGIGDVSFLEIGWI